MNHFLVSETTILDPAWLADYMENVPALVAKYGGSYFARALDVSMLEGTDAPQFYALLSFPTKDAAQDFYDSPEYQPYKEARQAGAKSRMLIVSWEAAE